jgi:hypothetical protein
MASWITAFFDETDQTASGGAPSGNVAYETKFDLTGNDLSKIKISGGLAADNSVTVYLNGANAGVIAPSYASLTAFTLTSGFVQGVNTLDFVVTNGTGPTGLIVNASGNWVVANGGAAGGTSADVPLPPWSLAVLATGLALAAARAGPRSKHPRRPRRR